MLNFSRWVSLACAILIGTTAGSAYGFGIFSQELANILHYTLTQVQMVASMGAVGQYSGVFAGFFFVRYGPKYTVLIGAILSFIGFYMLHMYISLKWSSSFIEVCLANFISQLGAAFFTTVTVSNSVLIFPASERGRVVGICKGTFALSTSIFAQYHISMFNHDVNSYLLFMAIYIPCLTLLLLPFISQLPVHRAERFEPIEIHNNISLNPWLLLTVWLSCYLACCALVEFSVEPTEDIEILMTTGMFIIMLSYFLLPKFVHKYVILTPNNNFAKISFENNNDTNDDNDEENNPQGEGEDIKQPLSTTRLKSSYILAEKIVDQHLEVHREVNFTIKQMLQTRNFWLLACIFFCTAGSGLAVISNISQITESFGYNHKINDLYILLFGICNFLGRICFGIISDKYSSLFPRTLCLLICSLLMCISQFSLAIFSTYNFFISVTCVSLAYGGLFSMVASLVADIFGVKNHGINYGMADLSVIAASFLIATGMVSWTSYNSDELCIGNNCFQVAFYICGGLGIISSICSYLLHRNITHERGYQNVISSVIS